MKPCIYIYSYASLPEMKPCTYSTVFLLRQRNETLHLLYTILLLRQRNETQHLQYCSSHLNLTLHLQYCSSHWNLTLHLQYNTTPRTELNSALTYNTTPLMKWNPALTVQYLRKSCRYFFSAWIITLHELHFILEIKTYMKNSFLRTPCVHTF